MDTESLKQRLIAEGKASVLAHETEEYAIRGGLLGFDLCQALHTQADFECVLAERNRFENHLFDQVHEGKAPLEAYKEYRCATLQVDFVFQRLQVVWGSPVLSLAAFVQVVDIMAEWHTALCN